ncbi:30S ribosomal protein S17 [Rickettsiales endosymbiont of Paramecium tredecaurelia]|uniref:30S ribosomal protein S17 n=1 Tax=Candidatus Sarmatiella mevalonica TaxID=2770581 RepID=UPI001923A916|nr:30S ribosomal protein S17 [Candidatus Sarmatiella mevalonica]MBL3284570.1 30S ribosomal protein S17 [Candidatus Sarmatiella mevalonica]
MVRRVLSGQVVSDKQEKTVVVLVERRFSHPRYKKIIKRTKKYHAHDPRMVYKKGDAVKITECAPISKKKTWHVLYAAEA